MEVLRQGGWVLAAIFALSFWGWFLGVREWLHLRAGNVDRGRLDLVATTAAVLPLLGLLGTVLGMMRTFEALTRYDAAEVSSVMAGGVSQALVTTQAGLAAALPLVLIHGLLASRLKEK